MGGRGGGGYNVVRLNWLNKPGRALSPLGFPLRSAKKLPLVVLLYGGRGSPQIQGRLCAAFLLLWRQTWQAADEK